MQACITTVRAADTAVSTVPLVSKPSGTDTRLQRTAVSYAVNSQTLVAATCAEHTERENTVPVMSAVATCHFG